MHAFKTPAGWTAKKPNAEGTAWESVTIDGNEQAKLNTLFDSVIANTISYTDKATLVCFEVYSVDVSPDPVTYKSGIVNFRLNDTPLQQRF